MIKDPPRAPYPLETPLRPVITIIDRVGLSVCNCCGTQDGTVRMLSFRWEQREADGAPAVVGGGTSVGLCAQCRNRTQELLSQEART